MRKALRILAMSSVSLILIIIGSIIITHQSSSAFDLGLGFCVMGLFHWVFWPNPKEGKL